PLPRLEQDLPLDTDRSERCGLRDWILDDGASAAELFSGSALDLTPEHAFWEVHRNEIDEDDLSYRYRGQANFALAGMARRTVEIERELRIGIDAPEIHISTRVRPAEAGRLVFATEIPIGLENSVMSIDGQNHEPSQSEYHEAHEITVVGRDGSALNLSFSPPVDVWADRIRTTVKDVDGFRASDQGVSLVIALRVEGETHFEMTLSVPAPDVPDEQEDRPTIQMPTPPSFELPEEPDPSGLDQIIEGDVLAETGEPAEDPNSEPNEEVADLEEEEDSEDDGEEYEYEYEEVEEGEEPGDDEEYEYEYEEVEEEVDEEVDDGDVDEQEPRE
ncbi:MAG: alpha-amylase/4-alpha-glucanotransferase domain-containing protein, partial [Myxococcota bacterium]